MHALREVGARFADLRAMASPSHLHLHHPAARAELRAHLRHPGLRFGQAPARVVLPPRRVADVLADLHAAEFRAAHGAEMGGLVGFLGQGLVVEFAGGFGV